MNKTNDGFEVPYTKRMKKPTDRNGVSYTKSVSFEELGNVTELGLDYKKLEKIWVQGVLVYTVQHDEIKEWSSASYSIHFLNGNKQKVAEIMVHYAEEILIDDSGNIRVQRQK